MSAVQGLGTQMQQVAAQAVTGASQQAAGIQQATSAVNGLASAQAGATASSATFGATAGRSLFQLTQGLNLAGVSLGPVNQGLVLLGSQIASMPPKMSAVEAGFRGIAVAALALGAISTAFAAPQTKALAQLQTAVVNVGYSWTQYQDQIKPVIAQAEDFGNSQATSYSALSLLVAGLGNATVALQAFTVAEDLAAFAHIGLTSAAATLTRASEGYARGLKTYGINNLNLANVSQGQLTSAQNAGKSATDAVARAQLHLNNVMAAAGDSAGIASLGVDKLQKAQDALTVAEQNLADVQARNAAHAAAQATSNTALTDATMRLQEAQLRLAAVQQAAQERHAASADTLAHLATASRNVLDAQEAMARAQGGGIKAAQDELRRAIDEQRKSLDAAAKQQHDTIADQAKLKSAQDSVTRAQEALAKAHQQAAAFSKGATASQIADAAALRHAQEAVQRAQDGVTQAYRDQAAAGIRSGGATRGIAAAQLELQQAEERAAAAQAKLKSLQESQANAVLANYEKIAKAIESKMGGAAERSSKTLGGFFDRWKAKITDWLAAVGDGFGKWLIPIGLLGTALPGLGAAFTAMGGAAMAAWGLIGGATGAIAIIAIIAALAAGIYLIVKHWDAIKHAAGVALDFVRDKIGTAVDWVRDHWKLLLEILLFPFIGAPVLIIANLKKITDFIETIPGWIKDRFSDAASWLVDAGGKLVSGLIFGVGGAIGRFEFRAVDAGTRFARGIWDGFSSWAANLWNNIVGWIGTLIDKGIDLYDAAVNAGTNLVIGIWNGIADKASWLWDKVKNFASDLWNTFTNALGLGSPSKITTQYGQWIVEGLANGIDAHQRKAIDAARRLSAVVNSVPFELQAPRSPAAGGAVGVYGGTGGTMIVHNVTVPIVVHGSVTSERELTDVVKDTLIRSGLLPATANYTRIGG